MFKFFLKILLLRNTGRPFKLIMNKNTLNTNLLLTKEKNSLNTNLLQNKCIEDSIDGDLLLYGYMYNNRVKFTTSLKNKNRTLAPGDFIIYGAKQDIEDVKRHIKLRFTTRYGYIDHCSITELRDFVIKYLKLMRFKYISIKKKSIPTS